ncbi:c-type cytochrome [Deinococcus sonorensis]|uniref:C-type cytochrome n=2 Tax=Deinococcus sonorensis TaxID=309891 RepID=A0AAU7UF72_9DEIO
MNRILLVLLGLTTVSAQAATPAYTKAQATQGAAVDKAQCALCHGSTLQNGGAPKLAGSAFLLKWGSNSLDDFHSIMSTTMPQTHPGALKPEQYINLVAYVLQQNGFKPGTTALKAANLKQYTFRK